MSVPPVLRIRLEKAAEDNGFDLPEPPVGDWLCFGSSHAPIQVWLTSWSGTTLIVAVSHAGVAAALTDGVAITNPLPSGAVAARGVGDIAALDRLLRRTYMLARTLPNALWRRFAEETADLPRTTEAERLVVQRRGQALFRDGLMALWGGRCAITGLAVPALLRASHAKPWKDATDEERLDVYNGLLLVAHLDAAFDAGLITIEESGFVRVSDAVNLAARDVLGLKEICKVRYLLEQHYRYFAWHRDKIYNKSTSQQPNRALADEDSR